MQRIILIILACLVLVAAGCGGADPTPSAGEKALEWVERKEKREKRAAANQEKAAKAAEKKAAEEAEKLLAEAPKPHVPSGPPPKKLVIEDKKTGSGPVAEAGDQISVHYVGVLYKTKKPFAANVGKEEPFSFKLGGQEVIKGWEKGIVGMRVRGQRVLIIPPGLAYGSEGHYPIPSNSTLVFLIELLNVK